MISQGVWILMLVAHTSLGEITLQPYAYFPNQQLCLVWRDREAREHLIIMTCMEEYPYEL